jgi:UrcA family protein
MRNINGGAMFTSNRFIARNVAVAALTVLPSLVAIESASAGVGAGDAPSVTVRYGDLNLTSQEGIASLYGRIRNAAAAVCSALDGRDRMREMLWHDCYNHAVANAVQTVHNETLSAYHFHRIRGPGHRDVEAPTNLASR